MEGIGHHSPRRARHGDRARIPPRPADASGRAQVLGSYALGNTRRCTAADRACSPHLAVRTDVHAVSIGLATTSDSSGPTLRRALAPSHAAPDTEGARV